MQNILKQNQTLHNGIHTQIHRDLPWKPWREKPTFLELHSLSFSFIALYKMFTIQYKVSTNLRNPNSNSEIRMPWTAKQLITEKVKKWKSSPKHFSRALLPNPPIRIVDNGFGANAPKSTEGSLVGYPHMTPLSRRHITRGASRARGQTPCKEYNINPTFSHLLFSLHTRRTQNFRSTIRGRNAHCCSTPRELLNVHRFC